MIYRLYEDNAGGLYLTDTVKVAAHVERQRVDNFFQDAINFDDWIDTYDEVIAIDDFDVDTYELVAEIHCAKWPGFQSVKIYTYDTKMGVVPKKYVYGKY